MRLSTLSLRAKFDAVTERSGVSTDASVLNPQAHRLFAERVKSEAKRHATERKMLAFSSRNDYGRQIAAAWLDAMPDHAEPGEYHIVFTNMSPKLAVNPRRLRDPLAQQGGTTIRSVQ